MKFLEASRINRNRFSINRWRYLTSTLIRLIPIRIHCASKGWPTEFGQIDATCHSLNATPFARSKGGGRGERGDGAREIRAKEVLTSRTFLS